MKLSTGLWKTYKEAPADAEIPSHQLMIRAGLIHKTGVGLYSYLPFALKSIFKVQNIIREELDKVGCFEILMPVVTPGELWQESGRWNLMGEMLKIQDKNGRDLCISPTNEEAVADIFRKSIKSYKNLPVTLYQINTKFRDEIRPRFGPMRGREFIMKDAYSFHGEKNCLDKTYAKIKVAYEKIFERLGLGVVAAMADGGAMADSEQKTHEFHVLADNGEDTLVFTESGSYAANVEKAQARRAGIDFVFSDDEVQEVATLGMKTIKSVCEFLKCPEHQSLKCLLLKAVAKSGQGDEQETFVLAGLLGDDELNFLKLKNALKVDSLLPASAEEMDALGLVLGFIGPLKSLRGIVRIVLDSAIDERASFCVGAGKRDVHLVNFRPARDAHSFEQMDIRLAKEGDLTLEGERVRIKKGIEVGHIFQLGDKYTRAMDIQILDKNGKTFNPLMGCYGLGVSRLVAAAIEKCHDDKGIVWPKAMAPAQVHFILIAKDRELIELATGHYQALIAAGIEVIFDDRSKLGPGFKLKDADLLGLPLQLIFGERDYKKEGMVEIKQRKTGESEKISLKDSPSRIQQLWDQY